ncbi:MAG: uncharacterized protein JWN95_176 [Frankiales bacterium]|nr:uncharacterized protein [Frankiales bacterium]
MVNRALVLAGGGVAGIAWELGVLHGVAEHSGGMDPDLVDADLVIGTSAGSAVAAQVTSGAALAMLYDRQLSESSTELEVAFDRDDLMARFAEAAALADSPTDLLRRLGTFALAADTVDEATRRAVVAARLPVPTWPGGRLLIPAVDAESGEFVVFNRESGVELVDAVTASCAVPGIWPPVSIDGHRYIDGGMRSGTNADLAAGSDRVLIITPTLADVPAPWGNLADEIALLGDADVLVIHADDASTIAFGTNPLSPATRGPAARAGRAIGRDRAEEITAFWR